MTHQLLLRSVLAPVGLFLPIRHRHLRQKSPWSIYGRFETSAPAIVEVAALAVGFRPSQAFSVARVVIVFMIPSTNRRLQKRERRAGAKGLNFTRWNRVLGLGPSGEGLLK
jgi:hypothetical protein